MATATSIINRALRLAKVLAAGESPAGAESADALTSLNAMLSSWNTERLTVYNSTRTTKVLTASDNEYTIGASGDINVTQPVRISHAAIVASGDTVERPIQVLTRQQWAERRDKSSTGLPDAIFLQRNTTATLGKVLLYLVPSAGDTLVLYLESLLTPITDVTAAIVLPEGYEDAITYNLAVRLADEYTESGVSASVLAQAIETKANIKRANMEPIEMKCDSALTRRGGYFDIKSDTFI